MAEDVTPVALSHATVASSEAAIAALAASPDPRHQAQAAVQKAILEGFKAGAAYAPPPADTRTPAQIVHDKRFGVQERDPAEYAIELPASFEATEGINTSEVLDGAKQWLSALGVDPVLGGAIVRDILAAEEVDQEQVAATMNRTSLPYDRAVADAEFALQHAGRAFNGVALKATDLPAFALSQLAIWGSRLRVHGATRPR